ncbi:MAG: hypothetical protein KC416_02835 [Myxococcales bacterium]|nr:hypothetical protein [Myxococcales bacterium]
MDAPDGFWHRLETIPVLGLLAATAAVADLGFSRIALPTLVGTMDRDTLLHLNRLADIPRNVAAVAGIVALTLGVVSLVSLPGPAAIARRLGLAGFSGLFLPMITVATFLPSEQTTRMFVFSSIVAANFLTVLTGFAAARRTAPRGLRLGIIAASVAFVSGFVAFVCQLLPGLARIDAVARLGHTLAQIGEVAFLAAPLLIGFTILPRILRKPRWLILGISFLLGGALGALLLWVLWRTPDVPTVLYGAFGLRGLEAKWALLYAVPITLAITVSVLSLTSTDRALRQVGAGICLLVAAGFAPTTPVRLLMMTAGMVFLARSSIALGERLISGRIERPSSRPPPAPGA